MWSTGYVCPNFMFSALSISLQVEETITIIKMMIQLYTLMLWWLNNIHGCANTAILYKKNATATVKWPKFWIINMKYECMLICLRFICSQAQSITKPLLVLNVLWTNRHVVLYHSYCKIDTISSFKPVELSNC